MQRTVIKELVAVAFLSVLAYVITDSIGYSALAGFLVLVAVIWMQAG